MTRFKAITLLVLACLVVVGCAARSPKVPMPGENAGPVEWREYYDDQFKVLRDKVPPPSAQAPLEQMVAYQDAKHSYDKKKVIGLVATGCALSVALITFISTMSQL